MPSRTREELGRPLMRTHADSRADATAASTTNSPAIHNSSVGEDAAREGLCAQVHLPTGRMCALRHGHEGSCEFTSAEQVNTGGQADTALGHHRADVVR